MTGKDTNKFHSSHIGWQEDYSSNNKMHYYLISKGAFDISICGKPICNKDLHEPEVMQDQCSHCLKQLEKLKNGELSKIEIDGMLI